MGLLYECGHPKISIGQDGMTAVRQLMATWNDWPSTVLSLMGTPVFFNGTFMMVGRQQYPGIPTLSVDSIDVEGKGRNSRSSIGAGWNCTNALFTVNYAVPKEEDDKDENGDPATYLVESLDYAVEIVVAPVQVVDQQDLAKLQKNADQLWAEQVKAAPSSNPDGSPALLPPKPIANAQAIKKTVKRHIRVPSITYKVTIPRLAELPSRPIQKCIGRINKTQIFGGEPGHVLFDGPSAERESAFFTQRFWRVNYQFIYQPFGWNNTLHPDTLLWVPAKAIGADNDPYEARELKQLFPKPYVVRE